MVLPAACSDSDSPAAPSPVQSAGSGGSAGQAGSGGDLDGGAGQAGASGEAGQGVGGNAGDLDSGVAGNGGSPDQDAGPDGQAGQAGQAGQGGSAGSGGTAGGSGDAGPVLCPTTFRFHPSGATPGTVVVAGEWHDFNLSTATPLVANGSGQYEATVQLPPGLHAYKLVVDGNWMLDPAQGRRKYVGSTENSAVKVRDCSLPSFEVVNTQASRPQAGAGSYRAELRFVDAIDHTGPDSSGLSGKMIGDGLDRTLTPQELSIDGSGKVTVHVQNLPDGKYRVVLRSRTQSGRISDPYRLVFWIEQEPFSWKDAIIYMVLTDRFVDGDSSNNPGPTPQADPRGDWKGGDLEGLRQKIADGTLDALGVRAIWLTPFQTNPTEAYLASDNYHRVTGYHGYWPVRAREVDPRLGGEQALRAMIAEAHRHGIRILQDYVINHVHEQHEYVASHPEWFRQGCVCGTDGCDWTGRALDCMFASYMPDINHTVPEANAAFVADAIYWLDEFDIDGLRVDAVKHVEEIATRNLAVEVRETFEPGGTDYFMMGETAMGWNDCADPCNDEQYGTISKYIGPFGLDGQFDFVLYHGVSYRVFAESQRGMLHADYWLQHSLQKYPSDAIMTPYIGSHDTARFATLADPNNRHLAGNQWDHTASAPSTAEPYERIRIAMAWLLSLPGAPLLYYGDEYGQWGGVDPNNRLMWRPPSQLNADESQTLSFIRKIGQARREIPALRRGEYISLYATEDVLVFGRRITSGNAAVVALNRADSPATMDVEVTSRLGWTAGTALHDRLGNSSVTVAANGSMTLTIPSKSAVIFAP